MEIRVLGPVEVRRGSERVELAGTMIRTVLASLVLARGTVVTDGRLSGSLWGWHPPATMNAQIYTYVSRLRGLLGPSAGIVRQARGYLLCPDPLTRIDAVEFERLAARGGMELAHARYESAAATLGAALGLWRGPALTNVTAYLADAEAAPLEEGRTSVLENRIEAELATGLHRRLLPELTGLVSRHPLRERFRIQLMTALYRSDRQADALAVYHDGRRLLGEELGLDPGPALSGTYQAILSGRLATGRAVVRGPRPGRCAGPGGRTRPTPADRFRR